MVLNWILFVLFGALAYIGFAIMGQYSDSTASSWFQAVTNLFTKPVALAALVVGNALWVIALYYGLRETKAAVPALIAVGVVTGFFYALAFFGAQITFTKIAGLLLILIGIYLLA